MIDTTLRTVFNDLIDINIENDSSPGNSGNNPSVVIDAEPAPAKQGTLPALSKKQGGFLNIFGKKGK
jgi:hypothetical protein